MTERIVSPDGAIALVIERTDDDVSVGFEPSEWHTHGDILATQMEMDSAESAVERFVAEVVENRVVLACHIENGKLAHVRPTTNPAKEVRRQLLCRYWNGESWTESASPRPRPWWRVLAGLFGCIALLPVLGSCQATPTPSEHCVAAEEIADFSASICGTCGAHVESSGSYPLRFVGRVDPTGTTLAREALTFERLDGEHPHPLQVELSEELEFDHTLALHPSQACMDGHPGMIEMLPAEIRIAAPGCTPRHIVVSARSDERVVKMNCAKSKGRG